MRDLPARGSWAESTADPRLCVMRDEQGNGGVDRVLWEITLWQITFARSAAQDMAA